MASGKCQQPGHSNTVTTTKTYGHWLEDYGEDPEETAREDQAALRTKKKGRKRGLVCYVVC